MFSLLLFAIFLSSGCWLPLAQAKLYAECAFGKVNAWEEIENNNSSVLKLSGQLPSSRNLSHSCIVKTDNKNSPLCVRAKRNETSRQGSLHLSVYGKDASVLQGHLDIPNSALGLHWSSLPFCPFISANEVEKYFAFSGTPGVVFTAEVSQDQEVKLDDPKTFEINQRNPINVFQFIPPEDISKTQLDVTVTSNSDVPAYLKVSRDCKDVKDNIHSVDYEGESIRLSFAKKGRITLSKVSFPPLTDCSSSWFIGIALNNASGTTKFNARKNVTLTLTRSFNYSYAGPISFLVFVSLGCGGVLAFWAVIYLKEPHVYPCANNSERQFTYCDVSVLKAMPKIISKYWFRGQNNTFSYITAIVGWVLFVGAVQFVFADWYVMIHEGDRDKCYYNDFCYRVLYYDIPFNLMISNLTYIIHAVILALSILNMEAELFVRCKKLVEETNTGGEKRTQKPRRETLPNHVLICPNIASHFVTMSVPEDELDDENYAEAHKRKFSFSMGYAFAWALLFEGMFSTLYHLCPSRMTFQFDTAFMFVIAGLIVTLLYNGIELEECSNDGVVKKGRVGAANFFLGFVVPLYFFNYFGTLHHSETGLNRAFEFPLFYILLPIWYIMITAWVVYKLYPSFTTWSAGEKIKSIFLMLALAAPFVCLNLANYPDAFLVTCIAESVIAVFWRVIKKLIRSDNGTKTTESVIEVFWRVIKKLPIRSDQNCTKTTKGSLVLRVAFFITMFIILIFAGWLFLKKPSTNKTMTPEKSRNLNHECAILGFFDWHDIWHILSSFALLMGAHFVMYISYESPISTENSDRDTSGDTFGDTSQFSQSAANSQLTPTKQKSETQESSTSQPRKRKMETST